MIGAWVRTFCVAVLAALILFPTLVSRMIAPANYGAHGLTTGFGRGRLDLPGIVSLGSGGSVDLPNEPLTLIVRLSGEGSIQLHGRGVDRIIVATETPTSVHLDLAEGGSVSIESASRIRLHELVVERPLVAWVPPASLAALGAVAVFFASRGSKQALGAALFLLTAFLGITSGTLSAVFTRIALARLAPALAVFILFLPLGFALWTARFPSPRRLSRLAAAAFVSSLVLAGVQLVWFEQPLPMGDPEAYLEMGGRFADAIGKMGSPLGLGPILSEIQPYLALPATGWLYGFLQLLGGGLSLIYVVQAVAMAVAVSALVSICETEIGPRAAKIALGLALLHPSFSILPGIVQPEPFILAAWTLSALVALHAFRNGNDWRTLLAAGLLLGAGLSLHPQGLSFLLLAMVLCFLPWASRLARRPTLLAPILGVFSVLLPVAAAERFAKPLAYVLDKEYGFFAYTSPHPLGFWLYLDSDGWQGPLRIEDTTYQKELLSLKGDTAVSSTFGDVASFVSRHFGDAAQIILTNLHRLWHQPDNPFARPFVLPYDAQILFHRSLIVLFIVSLPVLLGSRLAILALPFVMLSMTYPAYHVFNKYATPALPFTIIGASVAIDRLLREGPGKRPLMVGLLCAALGAVLPAVLFARYGVSGDLFLGLARGLIWIGLSVALARAVQLWGVDVRSRLFASLVGFTVLLASSFAASRTDTTRGTWSASLDQSFEVSCHFNPEMVQSENAPSLDSAWILVDAQAKDAKPPRIEVNGHALAPAIPTMPTFGLASLRGHRDPAAFRQMWRAPVDEDLLTSGALQIRVSGGPETRLFGDIREGREGPRLSLGNWPHLSVYRLMHEGQYRLPVKNAPAQACSSSVLSGRPGIALVRIPAGTEAQLALKSARPLTWIF